MFLFMLIGTFCVVASSELKFSGNRTEIIQNCYDMNHNYLQMIADRVALETDKCSSEYDQREENARNDMTIKIGELLTTVNQVRNNLKFSGDIYSVLEKLTEVDIGNVEDLKTVAFKATLTQTNLTIQMAAINGWNDNCKSTVVYNSSMALNEIERGLMSCSLTGQFPRIEHLWVSDVND